MIFETVSAALGIGVLVTLFFALLHKEELHSLKRNGDGEINPNLKWWVGLSLIHVGIVFLWAWFLFDNDIIRLKIELDRIEVSLVFFLVYWVLFELAYWCLHRLQHSFSLFGYLTGHRGESSSALHHGMKPPYGPDYLTAFSSHPLDAFVVQFAAQSPWYWLYLAGKFNSNIDFRVSVATYGLTLSWLVYIGMRAHSRISYGGEYHCMHHDNPGAGPYSFSGFPERLYNDICR